ncbi:kinase-like protein, partial [Delitschia confertaspora ATCC 74209]
KRTSHISSFQKEVEILKMVDHPHIIKYITAYHQNASLNLIMSPVAQSTVKEYLASSGPIRNDFSRIQKWICCLSSALSHIHSRKIRHADIKPSNILIRDEDIFISDFGISRIVSEPDSTSSSISPSTPFYAAIEIATRQRHGRKADVFSFGCVVVELLTVAH